MKNLLGIHGDYFNLDNRVYESNTAIVSGGKVISAVSEERLSRKKMDGRVPELSVKEVLRLANMTASDIDEVIFSTRTPFASAKEYFQSMMSTFSDTGVLVRNKSKVEKTGKGILSKMLKGTDTYSLDGKNFTIRFIDHHDSHAAGAYFASPFDDALIITLDGGGNGLDGAAYTAKGTVMERFIKIPHFQSPGTMYSSVTHDFGFIRHRHEGKITGLAAYGKPKAKEMGIDNLIRYDKSKHRFIAPDIARHHMDINTKSTYFSPLLQKFSREDIACTVQHIFEQVILDFISDAAETSQKKGFNTKNICLSGGCFANVRLNQLILELPYFTNAFVYPAMGDGGVGSGAALLYHYQNGGKDRSTSVMDHVYLGASYSENEMEKAFKDANIPYSRYNEVEVEIAKLLKDGKVVGRFNGAMEYGPRALGNRSIIGAPFDPSINDWLNVKLKRTEFMPFAPSMTFEGADEYLVGYSPSHKTADFMTITYSIKPGMKEKIPAVVHVDNTARPQIVRKETNPSYHKIISEFGKLTGIPVVLNTSFNIHEEPIICSPDDAVRGFLGAKLDYLAMGPFIAALPAS